jgi:spermidine/putrescine transport system permease protein
VPPDISRRTRAAALLCFSLSFDDFIITNLNGGTTTFPMFVWGSRIGTSPYRSM